MRRCWAALTRWSNEYFATNWARVPFQPVLYMFLFLGALLVVSFDLDYPAFEEHSVVFWQWIALSLICPPMALSSWILIRWHPGRPRYVGFWVRLGADAGQLASLSCFLTVISQDIDYIASELYAAEIFSAVWWFVIILVIRDIWKLAITERLAAAIDKQQRAEGDDGCG
ncbi:hypothetical protein SEA_JOIEB_60 [Mycobacterium phage JoieB]|uniref:Uncharacterized protein n=3 Tax=Marvinvirus marvin TaxID=1982092 RepID=A0A385UG10_9CAUD|nr:hypothetical protein SEA_VASUNZINGA_58 [Mycobacterium phage VasuNzinga]QFP94197.1 hypothetical protein SEA_JOIEB_60 [Mycobacterium phage JoieB]QFP96921.1 hypothetical protein SEA_PRINGAR_58 [Mycobacterium phage Pringar]